jgi:hypothetical protein
MPFLRFIERCARDDRITDYRQDLPKQSLVVDKLDLKRLGRFIGRKRRSLIEIGVKRRQRYNDGSRLQLGTISLARGFDKLRGKFTNLVIHDLAARLTGQLSMRFANVKSGTLPRRTYPRIEPVAALRVGPRSARRVATIIITTRPLAPRR